MPDKSSPSVTFTAVNLGVRPYQQVWDLQRRLHELVLANPAQAFLIFVEHEPVLTMGKNAADANLLLSAEQYKAQGIDLVAIDRGGEVTAHNPGQQVVYPILSVRQFDLTPKKYVTILEQCVIDTLETFGIAGQTDPTYPGVWVGDEKICAVGVRIKQRITQHGIALNRNNSLNIFEKIVPCGISDRLVTSFEKIGVEAPAEIVIDAFVKAWERRLGSVEFTNDINELLVI